MSLGLDWFSQNKEVVIPFIKQLARETDMDAEDVVEQVAQEFDIDLGSDLLADVVEQFLNPVDSRQQRLPSVASTRRKYSRTY